ncbi:type II toxin-antitoxin system death-on-curing family toxin [Rubrivirga sp.]|uniref:type II toxin-antitoxin system death-on-curing family toxin n=1 Tax=Rubrivirga sp. TaxID=1885344 RepID=UPI003C70C87D
MDEPLWIARDLADAIHSEQLRAHGGARGVRDENLLESALARPRQRWAYEEDVDLESLAAAYAFGVAKNPPFIDGNKRTAFVVMGVFLFMNGVRLSATEPEATVTVLAVAAGDLDEVGLAAWCRGNSAPTSA